MQTPQVTRDMLKALCRRVLAASSLDDACDIIERYARQRSGAWRTAFRKLAIGLRLGQAPFTIFAEGNSKLPFYGFSALPEFTCPGAGECLAFCYSFRAWRYPAAFCRQLQNTLLLRWSPSIISDSFRMLPHGSILRLYVDGDIDSVNTLAFWMRSLRSRRDVLAYGYSKSFEVLESWKDQALPWVENYRLNLSSGSKYEDDVALLRDMEKLQITRGYFVAVPIRGNYAKGFARFDSPEYHAEVRKTARDLYGTDRVFSCPGKCGECLPSGEHACGSDRFANILIAIGEHN